MAIPSAQSLVEALRHSPLLEPAQLAELMRTLPGRPADPLILARDLMGRGWLSPFQINQIFQGRIGDLTLGGYVLLERLGEGGMGQVFKARQHKLRRVVALKVIRKERLANAELIRRFYHEIRAAARLSHPNIVHAYDADQAGGTHYFAMEYVEGTDLGRFVKQHGPLPVALACDCVRQAALGLQHVCENGMVHRDIKPANLMLARQGGLVKILDMGLTRLTDPDAQDSLAGNLTRMGTVMGTLDYIAPEQAMCSRAADIRSDLYSLGCTFYYLLAGQVPFPGDEALAKLLRHQSEDPVPVEQLRPDVPSPVGAVVRKLMAKRREDRFQTPDELVLALAARSAPEVVLPPPAPAADCSGAGDNPALHDTAPTGATLVSLPDFADVSSAPPSARRAFQRRQRRRWLAMAGGVMLLSLAVVFALRALGFGKHSPSVSTPPDGPAPEITNSLKMKLVRIPAGMFRMGSPDTEPGRQADEGPVHEVTIRRPFYLGVHLVTVGNFRAFVAATDYRTEAEKRGGAGRPSSQWEPDPACTWRNPGWEQGDDSPVACLSWNDVRAFCRWLSDHEHRTYRLPTEAEWEYACRAGSTTAYSFGDDPKDLAAHAWHNVNAGQHAHPVGQLPPNPWGLHDMHGNLLEWCGDYYEVGYYQKSGRDDPQGPTKGELRVLRGGCWDSPAADCRCARRCSAPPGDRRSDRGGFRVVLVTPN